MANSYLDNLVTEITESITKAYNEEYEKCMNGAARDYFEYVCDNVVEDLFRDSLTQDAPDGSSGFYNDYTPIHGGYQRTFGMKNTGFFTVKVREDGLGIEGDFHPEVMTTYRQPTGDLRRGLFDIVFFKGQHGGATGTDSNNVSVSSPHWRTPLGKYSRWGRPAFISPSSPYDHFLLIWNDWENNKGKKIFQDYLQGRLEKMELNTPWGVIRPTWS